ncbi:MAG: hypothetical protein IKA82_03365 [Clostridia bacterium]|nr:hypothetical protein [Clostridia bacterium]
MKTRKDIIKNISLTVTVVALVTLVAAYSCYHAVSVFDTTLMTGVIKTGSHEEYIDMPCAIFYDCSYLENASADRLRYSVENGAKVAKDQEVARLYSNDAATDADVRSIAEIDKQIDFFSDCLETGYLTQYAAGERLKQEYFKYLSLQSDGSYNTDSFIKSLNKYNVKANGKTDLLALIEALKKDRAELTGKLGTEFSSVTLEESGYFFTKESIDGYESVFCASAVTGMTPFKLNELKKSTPSEPSSTVYGKLMTTHKWYIAATLSKENCLKAELEKDATVSLTLGSSGSRINCKTVSVSAAQNGEVAVVFECSSIDASLISERFDTVTMRVAVYDGLAVPTSAMRNVNGVNGVFVLERGVLVFKRADVLAYSNGYYIISDGAPKENDSDTESSDFPDTVPYPKINDVVIVSGEGLYEGKVID